MLLDILPVSSLTMGVYGCVSFGSLFFAWSLVNQFHEDAWGRMSGTDAIERYANVWKIREDRWLPSLLRTLLSFLHFSSSITVQFLAMMEFLEEYLRSVWLLSRDTGTFERVALCVNWCFFKVGSLWGFSLIAKGGDTARNGVWKGPVAFWAIHWLTGRAAGGWPRRTSFNGLLPRPSPAAKAFLSSVRHRLRLPAPLFTRAVIITTAVAAAPAPAPIIVELPSPAQKKWRESPYLRHADRKWILNHSMKCLIRHIRWSW